MSSYVNGFSHSQEVRIAVNQGPYYRGKIHDWSEQGIAVIIMRLKADKSGYAPVVQFFPWSSVSYIDNTPDTRTSASNHPTA